MTNTDLIERICAYVDRKDHWGVPMETELPGFFILATKEPTALECYLYHAVVCLILQGHKETMLGERVIEYGEGSSVINSHDLHVNARVTEASAAKPYLAVVLTIDLDLIRSLYNEVEESRMTGEQAGALEISDTDPALLNAMARYFDLLDNPADAKVMAPLILKEIHYRLLTAPHGGMLRKLVQRNSPASRISRAIQTIRQDFAEPLAVAELADTAGMSASSFHEHFKTITATTPLQYQKDLRLMEARRLLSEGQLSVSTAAFEVGYESPTQFSREYSRKFGVSPSRDLPREAVAV